MIVPRRPLVMSKNLFSQSEVPHKACRCPEIVLAPASAVRLPHVENPRLQYVKSLRK